MGKSWNRWEPIFSYNTIIVKNSWNRWEPIFLCNFTISEKIVKTLGGSVGQTEMSTETHTKTAFIFQESKCRLCWLFGAKPYNPRVTVNWCLLKLSPTIITLETRMRMMSEKRCVPVPPVKNVDKTSKSPDGRRVKRRVFLHVRRRVCGKGSPCWQHLGTSAIRLVEIVGIRHLRSNQILRPDFLFPEPCGVRDLLERNWHRFIALVALPRHCFCQDHRVLVAKMSISIVELSSALCTRLILENTAILGSFADLPFPLDFCRWCKPTNNTTAAAAGLGILRRTFTNGWHTELAKRIRILDLHGAILLANS